MSIVSLAADVVLAQPPPMPEPTIPNPAPGVPPQFQAFGDMLVSLLKWVLMVAGVCGILFCSIMMVVGRRNRNQLAQQGIFDTGYVLLGLATGSIAAVIVGMFSL